jgi:hypothetical protein
MSDQSDRLDGQDAAAQTLTSSDPFDLMTTLGTEGISDRVSRKRSIANVFDDHFGAPTATGSLLLGHSVEAHRPRELEVPYRARS